MKEFVYYAGYVGHNYALLPGMVSSKICSFQGCIELQIAS